MNELKLAGTYNYTKSKAALFTNGKNKCLKVVMMFEELFKEAIAAEVCDATGVQ